MSLQSDLSEALATAGFTAGWRAVRLLPAPAAYGLFNRVADVLVARDGRGVRRLRSNYAVARPELDAAGLDELVRAGMRSYMRYYCEAFRLPSLRGEDIDAAVRAVPGGLDEATAVARSGRTTVMFVGHNGNFDLAAAWAARHLAPVATIAERLRPEAVYQQFVRYRNAIDMTIVPLTGGPDPFAAITQIAGAGGHVVALAADRDLSHNGIEVDYLGRRARMAQGPAVLALRTGAPLFAARVYYEPAPRGQGLGGYRTVIDARGPLVPRVSGGTRAKVADLVQQCADWVSDVPRHHTSSWHMMQRVFVEDLEDLSVPSSSSGGGAAR